MLTIPKFLKKLELYGIHGKTLNGFKSSLRNRKQYIQCPDKNKADFLSVTCGVPQGSILGPPLFLLYVNDLPNASKILDRIMVADDTNLLFSNCNISSIDCYCKYTLFYKDSAYKHT